MSARDQELLGNLGLSLVGPNLPRSEVLRLAYLSGAPLIEHGIELRKKGVKDCGHGKICGCTVFRALRAVDSWKELQGELA
jgi:hypothetical protein